MLEILYYIFIFPVEQVLEWALFTLFKATKNYGVSIILLSLIMQLFMLKLTFYFDKKAASFGALKAQCDSKIKEFKRVFKGAELQSYIRTLYKQKHFHPIFALFGLGGLALQIPFFIAMIHLVENAEYLQSVRFLWIDDLSKPDSIMLFGLSIHILPLLMTAFTLINVFYSSKELGARVQGSLIALLFLVLLYSMPSALVLYWTCNMFFSLLKEIFKHKKHSSLSNHSQDCVSLEAVITTKVTPAPKSTQNSQSNTAIARMRESADRVGVECRDSNDLNLSQDARIAESRMESKITSSKQNSKNTESKTSKSKLQVLFFNIFTPHATIDSKTYKTYRNISILAILNICFIICVFSPYAIYSSDVSQFDISQTYQTLGALFGFFILSSFGLIYFTSFFYKTRLLKLGAWGVSVILCIGLVYTFVLVGDYGVMLDGMQFSQPENMYSRRNKLIDIGVIIVSAWVIYLLKRYLFFVLRTVSIVLIVLVVGNTIKIVYEKQSFHQVGQMGDIRKPPYTDEMLSFSKEENILVFVFDGFTGDHFSIMLGQYPEFKEYFDGFVFYPNTLTTGAYTDFGTPAILGGYEYSSYHLSKNPDKFNDLSAQAFTKILNQINAKYDVMLNGIGHIDRTILLSRLDEDIRVFEPEKLYGQYGDWFIDNFDMGEYEISFYKTKYEVFPELISMGIFKFVPKYFKRFIYLPQEKWNGRYAWLFGDSLERDGFRRGLQYASLLRAYSLYSNTNSTKPTFKYFQDLTTHVPFLLNVDNACKPEISMYETVLPKNYQEKILGYYEHNVTNGRMHYDNEVCAILSMLEWLKWMKANGVYSNSTIIFTSDHGMADGWRSAKDVFGKEIGFAESALLMVKKKNINGEMRIDNRLMSNADTLSFICAAIGDNECVREQTKLKEVGILHAITDMIGNKPRINKLFLINDDMYDASNWQDITESVKNGTFKIDGIEH